MPADLGPWSGSIKSAFKHTWLFAVSIQRVKMAPELVVSLFLWVLRRRRAEIAKRVVLRRREARKRRFRFLQQILLTQELLLVPSTVRQHCIGEDDPGVFGESHAVHVQTGGKILFLILLLKSHKSGIFYKAHAG